MPNVAAGEMYSLTRGATEIYLQYPANFNLYDGLYPARVTPKKMIIGTNYQLSGVHHSDGRIAMSGAYMPPETQSTLLNWYLDGVPSQELTFTAYITSPPQQWRVAIVNFVPVDITIDYDSGTLPNWRLELAVIGKLIDGEVIP